MRLAEKRCPATSPSIFRGIWRGRNTRCSAIMTTARGAMSPSRRSPDSPAAGRRRSGASGSRRATGSRSAPETPSTGSPSTSPRWAWDWSSSRSTSMTTPRTSRGAWGRPRRACSSSRIPGVAAALAKCVEAGRPLPRLVVLRPEKDETAATLATFLPEPAEELAVDEFADDTLATICFTSGTAGRPKGVMLSHANIIANVGQCAETGMARHDDVFLSMLPLSHMFERTGGYYLPLSLGAKVAFSRGVAQIADDLLTQAPTVIFAVPRIFDRFQARIAASLAKSPAKRRLFDACVARGFRVATGKGSALDRMLAPGLQRLVGKPILARLGGRLRLAVVGGAALDPSLAHTFIGLGLGMLQGYGMTEASPVISVNRDDDNVPESVGPPLPGIEVRLGDGGELLVKGRNVMLGYWKNPEATRRSAHRGRLAAHRRCRRDHRRQDLHPWSRQGRPRAFQWRKTAAAGCRVRDPARSGVRAGDAGRRRQAVRRAARGITGDRRKGADTARQRQASGLPALDARAAGRSCRRSPGAWTMACSRRRSS